MKIIKAIIKVILLQIVMMIPILNVAILVKGYKKNEDFLKMLKSKLTIIWGDCERMVTFRNLEVLTESQDYEDFMKVERWMEHDS